MPAAKKVATKKVAVKKSVSYQNAGIFIQSAPSRGNFTKSAVKKAVKAARKTAK